MTILGPPLDESVGALTLGGFLHEVCGRFGGNEAIVIDDPLCDATLRWTYTELRRAAHCIGGALQADGVRRGDRVGILMGNRPEAVASIFAAALVGAVAVPLSTFSPRPELAFMLRHADVSVVLSQTSLLARQLVDDVQDIAASGAAPSLRTVFAVGHDSWDTVLAGPPLQPATVDPDDEALIIFSSGTTSTPKAMLHAHRAVTLSFWHQAKIFGRDESTRMWMAFPLFWTAGLNTGLGATLAAGGCWVAQETFEPAAALALMAREGVTEPYCLPHQTGALEEHPHWATADLSAMRCVFGKGAFARHPTVRGDEAWQMPVGYGLSETCAFFTAHPHDAGREQMKASMGPPLPGNELRVVDPDDGWVLGPGEDGELAVRGPTLIRGYLGAAPEDCFDADGFFHTGDAGFVDAEGCLHFTGRRTEMIKTGGANVSPAELEVQLRACAPVKLARVVGVPDPRLDQLVVACVTVKDGMTATEDDIKAFLRERVAAYKVPKRVLFFDDGEIPMTGSDAKVRDADLAALVDARMNRLRGPTQ